MNIASGVGQGTLTIHGKLEIAKSMFGKGCAFLGAYILLRQHDKTEPTEYVALQNLCQSIEVILKSFLLFKNYDAHQPKLKKGKGYGHNLVSLLDIVVKEYSLHKPSAKSVNQLLQLEIFYCKHQLRYGTGLDIFISPHSIEIRRIVRLLARVIKLTQIELANEEPISLLN